MKPALLAAPLLLLSLPSAHRGAAPPYPPAARKKPDDPFRPYLTKHCQECHSGRKPKGGFGLDKLAPDFDDAASRERWLAVLKRVRAGEMPPPKVKPRPAERDAQALARWIEAKAGAARLAHGRTVLRRLNRVEYQNTVRDLLGIEVDFQEMLPADSSADGFDNIGEALHVSSFLMEKYLEAADTALGLAIANGPQPPLVKKRYSLKDQHQVKVTTERVFHDLSHHGKGPAKIDQLKKLETEKMKTLRGFLGKLKGTKEEDGVNLLDRTMVFFSSNLGDASTHAVKNMPVLLAGGGFMHGRHLTFDPKRHPPLCNLYASMLQRLGLEVDRFGSSTGTLTGLEMSG